MSTTVRRYVVCIHADDAGDLEIRKLYEVQTDASAAARGYLRVVDESGEDYLYPADWFVAIDVPREADRVLHVSAARRTSRTGSGTTPQRAAQSRRR
jgi:hypothetical protein